MANIRNIIDMIARVLQTTQYMIRATFVFAAVWAAIDRNFEVLGLAILSLLISTALPLLIERNYKLQLPIEFEFTLAFFVFATLFLGEAGDFYEKLWWWDIFLHGLGAVLFGLFGFIIMYSLREAGSIKTRNVTLSVLIFTFAVAIGALWEIIEFMLDATLGFNMQQGSLTDTMTDLVVDAVGAAMVAVAGYFYLHSQRFSWFGLLLKRLEEKNPHFFSLPKSR